MQTTTARLRGVMLLALCMATVATGCGRRAPLLDAGDASSPNAAVPTFVAPDGPSGSSDVSPDATPVASPATQPATGTPVPTPDLTSIETLLAGIDADLKADATATTDEGSPQ